MIVCVDGSSKEKRRIAENAVVWSIKKLGLSRLSSLNIDVKMKKMKEGEFGYCSVGDTIREFRLDINSNVSIKDLVATIIHEMVHVRQFARKEMDTDGMRWKSQNIPDDTHYMDLPWEKEAYRLEEKYVKEIWESNII
jgi:hypothetical protein